MAAISKQAHDIKAMENLRKSQIMVTSSVSSTAVTESPS